MSTHQSQVTGGNGGDDSAGDEEFTSTQLSINTTGTDGVNAINAGLFPDNAGESHRLTIQRAGNRFDVTLVSQVVASASVKNTKVIELGTIPGQPTVDVPFLGQTFRIPDAAKIAQNAISQFQLPQIPQIQQLQQLSSF